MTSSEADGAGCDTGAQSLLGLNAVTIQEEHLQAVQDILGYSFKDPEILIAALTHASHADSRVESNERLEFLGDAVLGMVVCHDLFEQFPAELEGDLTKIKSAVVSRRAARASAVLRRPRHERPNPLTQPSSSRSRILTSTR